MRSTFLSALLTILLIMSVTPAAAQYSEQQVQDLQFSAATLSRQAMQQRGEAEVLARQLQLPLRQVLPDGTIIELQRFEHGRPVYYITDNANAASSASADKIYPGGSMGFVLTGDGATLAVWDGGRVRTTHQELTGRVTQMDATSGLSDHATHVSGTMIAAGVKAQARGMAYEAELLAHDWTNDLGEMTARAAGGLQVSNHSYSTITGWRNNYRNDGRWAWFGNPDDNSPEDRDFGIYNSRAREWDNLVHNAPYYLPVKSAGNDRGEGPSKQPVQHWEYQGGWKLVSTVRDKDGGTTGFDCISTNANAKNILTVGAVEDIPGGYSTSTDVRMTSFSGWGPTDDGRIKPDIVANGTSLYSSLKSSNTAYASSSGTSMSSPSVAGCIGLLMEHQANLHEGSRLRASTIKALLLHSADEAGPAAGPDYMFGWGMINVATAAKIMQQDSEGSTSTMLAEEELVNDAALEYEVYSPGRGPIKVTICWTDPAGTAQPSKVDPGNRVLVNDLDLRLVDPQSAEHLPWVLDPSRPADVAARGDNSADNVEQVFISSPTAGIYTIRISHKGSLQGGRQIVSIVASVSNAPSLMSPPSGLTELSPNAALQWTPALGALSYEVQVSETPDFKNPVINATGVVNPWFPLTGLQRLNTYYWRVRVKDQQGVSDWSDIWSFETGGVPAIAGHALYFDGADDRLSLPHSSGFDEIEQQDAVTVEAWVKVLSWYNGFFSIVDKYHAASDFGWLLQMHSSGGLEFIGSTSAKCSFVPKLGEWNHIAVSYSRAEGKIRFFVNGARRCEVNYDGDIRETEGGPLYVGYNPSGGDEYSHGVIDELRIWKTARSENEINAHIYGSLTGNEPGLVTQMRLDEGRNLTTASDPGTAEAQLQSGPAWLVSSVPMDSPPVPVLVYPGQSSASIPVQPRLRWLPSTSAMNYRMQLADNPGFSDMLLDERDVTVMEWEAPVLEAETEYYWRANATNAVGTSDWSAAHRFVTAVAPPPAPELVSPRNASRDLPLLVTLLWNAPERAQRYHVQVSTDSLFKDAFLLDRSDLITLSADVKDLGNFQRYFWRVRAMNVGGSGPWSEIWSFVTLPAEPEAPQLLTPAADETGVSASPQFTWSSVTGADTYAMQLATDEAFADLLLDVSAIPFTKYAAANLDEGTWYYWRASATNSAGTGEWSAMRRFRTQRPAPEQVLLAAPSDQATDIALQQEFQWQAAQHAESYRIEVAKDDTFTDVVLSSEGVTALTHVPSQGLDELSTYYWRVHAKNESGDGPWSTVWSLTTGAIELDAPILIAPADSSTPDPQAVAFVWHAVPYADSYEVELTEIGSGGIPLLIYAADSTLTRELKDETTYLWRARAVRGSQKGPWSEDWGFTTTLRLPEAVTLIAPLAEVFTLISPVDFQWSESAPQVTRYWHEWAEDAQFVTNLQADSTIADTTASLPVSIQAATDFWWRVRAGNAAGWGPWSTSRRNRLQTATVTRDITRPQNVVLHQNYPNPVVLQSTGLLTTVQFALPARMSVQVEVRDLMGRIIATLAQGNRSAGTHTLQYDFSSLPAGQYLLMLRTSAGVQSRVMTLVR